THHQPSLSRALHILRRQSGSYFLQHQPFLSHADVSHLRHNRIHHANAGKRQRTLLQNLRCTFPSGVLHRHHHAPCASDEVHCAAHPLHHLSWDHPIRQAAAFIHFHRAQHAQINVRPADHGKRISARKIRRPRHLANGFFAGVDQVRVFLPLQRIRPNPQHSILGLQHHFNSRRNVIADERRHSNTKVHVEPIAQLTRNPFNDTLALVDVFPWLSNHFRNSVILCSRRIPRTRSVSLPSSFMIRYSVLGTCLPHRPLLNPPLIQFPLKNSLHIHRRSMNRIPV